MVISFSKTRPRTLYLTHKIRFPVKPGITEKTEHVQENRARQKEPTRERNQQSIPWYRINNIIS